MDSEKLGRELVVLEEAAALVVPKPVKDRAVVPKPVDVLVGATVEAVVAEELAPELGKTRAGRGEAGAAEAAVVLAGVEALVVVVTVENSDEEALPDPNKAGFAARALETDALVVPKAAFGSPKEGWKPEADWVPKEKLDELEEDNEGVEEETVDDAKELAVAFVKEKDGAEEAELTVDALGKENPGAEGADKDEDEAELDVEPVGNENGDVKEEEKGETELELELEEEEPNRFEVVVVVVKEEAPKGEEETKVVDVGAELDEDDPNKLEEKGEVLVIVLTEVVGAKLEAKPNKLEELPEPEPEVDPNKFVAVPEPEPEPELDPNKFAAVLEPELEEDGNNENVEDEAAVLAEEAPKRGELPVEEDPNPSENDWEVVEAEEELPNPNPTEDVEDDENGDEDEEGAPKVGLGFEKSEEDEEDENGEGEEEPKRDGDELGFEERENNGADEADDPKENGEVEDDDDDDDWEVENENPDIVVVVLWWFWWFFSLSRLGSVDWGFWNVGFFWIWREFLVLGFI